MKRILICLLAVCLLGLVLAGCSATGRVSPNGMYGNVSTTTDGRVNGTNDYYNGYSGRDGQTYNNTNGRTQHERPDVQRDDGPHRHERLHRDAAWHRHGRRPVKSSPIRQMADGRFLII